MILRTRKEKIEAVREALTRPKTEKPEQLSLIMFYSCLKEIVYCFIGEKLVSTAEYCAEFDRQHKQAKSRGVNPTGNAIYLGDEGGPAGGQPLPDFFKPYLKNERKPK